MTERWLPVNGFPYDVSDHGRVRNHHGIVLAPFAQEGHYQTVRLSRHNIKTTFYVHRLVAVAFVGPRPSTKHQVAHNDGNRLNNRATNLRWALQKENEADKILHGTRLYGSRIKNAKLTERAVLEIRASHETLDTLAARYGVNRSAIGAARNGDTWRRVRDGL